MELITPNVQEGMLEIKKQIQTRIKLYHEPPVPTRQDRILVPNTSFLILVNVA